MSDLRSMIVEHALWGVDNEPQIHYQQLRPIDGLGTPGKLPLSTDCSGFVTLCYAWSGAPDPNGVAYNGSGFTGTLLGHLPHISAGEALPGDLVVLGPGTGDHVVVIVEAGSDPLVVSHGQEAGPLRLRLSTETAAHAAPVTFLRGLGLDEPAAIVDEVPFPLPAGHWFGPPSQDPRNHSGFESAADRAAFVPWQQRMITRGWHLDATGRFDDATSTVCRDFQKEKGLEVDGGVGLDTWRAAWSMAVT